MTEKLPLPSVVAVPIDDPSLIRLIVLFASAVPLIVGFVSLVVVVPVDIVGREGGIASMTISCLEERSFGELGRVNKASLPNVFFNVPIPINANVIKCIIKSWEMSF